MFEGICVTGFGPFQGIKKNPTQKIIETLQKKPCKGVVKCDWLQVSIKAVEKYMAQEEQDSKSNILYLHLGVGNGLQLQSCGYNLKDFGCKDQAGEMPKKLPICQEMEKNGCLKTQLPLKEICQQLVKKGHPISVSQDPGRFLCNYIYFSSLNRLSKPQRNCQSLFVHFDPYHPHQQNMQVVQDLLHILLELAPHQ